MAQYITLNLVIMSFVLILLRPRASEWQFGKSWWLMLGGLFALTAVFDSLLIYLEIIAYDMERLSGITIGLAPVEDFSYPLLVALVMPILWRRLGRSKNAQ